jgi:hypothetical protein
MAATTIPYANPGDHFPKPNQVARAVVITSSDRKLY